MPLYKDSRVLSDFRGMPFLEPTAKSRKSGGVPMPAGAFADSVLRLLNQKQKQISVAETLAAHWRECVGEKLAGKCFVHSVKGATAFVSAENPQIKQMLAFSEKKILERVNAIDCCKHIKKIRFS